MSRKKRNKKHNPNKIINIKDRAFLKRKVTFYITGDDYVSTYCLKSKQVYTPTIQQAKILENQPFQWSVLIAVCGRDQHGEEYVKSELISSNQKYRQSELIEFLEAEHTQLIKSINRNHFISAAWIASPSNKDWNEKETFELLKELGAFRYAVDPNTKQVLPVEEAS